ncbi:MAG TPA: archaeosortase/exosortase family protein [Thermodesulfovibrionales bacterium]|nr:archaeosortase/exosortase family protein [Thermodesulfovibrionales bacterium]
MAQGRKDNKSDSGERKRKTGEISIWSFLIKYFMLMGLLTFVLVYKPLKERIDVNNVYSKAVVIVTAEALGISGISCTYRDSIISVPGSTLDVRFGCNGLEAVMIYSAAVVAFPAPWKKRFIGVLAGFLVIQAANILRITALVFSAIHYKNFLDYIHNYVTQGLMIAISLAVFFIYLTYAGNQKTLEE